MFKILLIDDEPLILQGLQNIIDDYFPSSFDTTCVTDGQDAISLLQQDFFHLILSDNKMPLLNGLDLLQLLKENEISSICVIISGYDDYQYIRTALKIGISDYLLKPVNTQELVNLLQKFLPRLDSLPYKLLPKSINYGTTKPFSTDLSQEVSYFDLPTSSCPYSQQDLSKLLQKLCQAFFSADEIVCAQLIHDIFHNVDSNRFSREMFQQQLCDFVYQLMDNSPQMIRIIAKYKLTENDLVSKIKNLSHISQLEEIFNTTIMLYMKELRAVQEVNAQYIVRKTMDYIEKNYMNEIYLDDLSSRFHLNPNYFSTLFRKQSGTTIRDYIRKVRISHAAEMLCDPTTKISDIALKVGYENAAHFNRAFKDVTSMSPGFYRKNMLNHSSGE